MHTLSPWISPAACGRGAKTTTARSATVQPPTGSQDRLRPVRLGGPARVVDVDTSVAHSLAADADGNLLSWGDERGDFSSQTRPRRVEALAQQHAVYVGAGYGHSVVAADRTRGVAWSAMGAVFAFGRNRQGQLGCGNTHPRAGLQQIEICPRAPGAG